MTEIPSTLKKHRDDYPFDLMNDNDWREVEQTLIQVRAEALEEAAMVSDEHYDYSGDYIAKRIRELKESK